MIRIMGVYRMDEFTGNIPKGSECYDWVDDGYGDVCMRICPYWFQEDGELAYCTLIGMKESVKRQSFLKEHLKVCDKE